MSDMFVQSLAANGEDIGTRFITKFTYIERMDLSCPKVIIELNDTRRFFQDDLGLINGVEITLGLGDAQGRGEALFVEKFTIGSSWCEGNTLTIEAMQSDIYKIKQPVTKPLMFVDKTPLEILGVIFPSYSLHADDFPIKATYHVLSGSTVALMLAQMEKDIGASIWIARGVLCVKQLSGYLQQKEAFKFEYGVNASSHPLIESYKRFHAELPKVRKHSGNYIVWDRVEGMIDAKAPFPVKFLSCTKAAHAINHSLYRAPVMDATLSGNGLFTAGLVVRVELTKLAKESIFDESVPSIQVLLGVRHFQQSMRYIAVAELGVINDAGV